MATTAKTIIEEAQKAKTISEERKEDRKDKAKRKIYQSQITDREKHRIDLKVAKGGFNIVAVINKPIIKIHISNIGKSIVTRYSLQSIKPKTPVHADISLQTSRKNFEILLTEAKSIDVNYSGSYKVKIVQNRSMEIIASKAAPALSVTVSIDSKPIETRFSNIKTSMKRSKHVDINAVCSVELSSKLEIDLIKYIKRDIFRFRSRYPKNISIVEIRSPNLNYKMRRKRQIPLILSLQKISRSIAKYTRRDRMLIYSEVVELDPKRIVFVQYSKLSSRRIDVKGFKDTIKELATYRLYRPMNTDAQVTPINSGGNLRNIIDLLSWRIIQNIEKRIGDIMDIDSQVYVTNDLYRSIKYTQIRQRRVFERYGKSLKPVSGEV